MQNFDIEKMDFPELRMEVKRLCEEFAKFKRDYDYTIYNLGEDNLNEDLRTKINGL